MPLWLEILCYIIGIGGLLALGWGYYRGAKVCYDQDNEARKKSIIPDDGR